MVGNKLEDPLFLEKIFNSDIVGLVELHTDKEVFMPGYNFINKNSGEKIIKEQGGCCFC